MSAEDPSPAAEEVSYCPPTRLRCRVLALLWIFPSLGALVILALDAPNWFRGRGLLEALGAVGLQSWIALVVLLVHVLLAFKARPMSGGAWTEGAIASAAEAGDGEGGGAGGSCPGEPGSRQQPVKKL